MTKQIQAYQKFIRTTPRKVRLVADMVRGMSVDTALTQLQVIGKFAADPVRKIIVQAKSNALQVGLDAKTLKVKSIMVEEGPTFKRWHAVSRGRAHSIFKRSCHIKVILEGGDMSAVNKPSEKTNNPQIETEKKER